MSLVAVGAGIVMVLGLSWLNPGDGMIAPMSLDAYQFAFWGMACIHLSLDGGEKYPASACLASGCLGAGALLAALLIAFTTMKNSAWRDGLDWRVLLLAMASAGMLFLVMRRLAGLAGERSYAKGWKALGILTWLYFALVAALEMATPTEWRPDLHQAGLAAPFALVFGWAGWFLYLQSRPDRRFNQTMFTASAAVVLLSLAVVFAALVYWRLPLPALFLAVAVMAGGRRLRRKYAP